MTDEDDIVRMMNEFGAQFEEELRVCELMDHLGIPYEKYQVHISDLDKIFSDPDKCKELIDKLRALNLKAFW